MTIEMDGVHDYPVSAGRTGNPAKRRTSARIAANTRWAHEADRVAATQPMRDAQQRKYEDQVDPDHTLRVTDPTGFAKRVESAKKADYARRTAKARETREAKKSA